MGGSGDIDGLKAAIRLLGVARQAAEGDGDEPYARGYRFALKEMRRLLNKAIAEAIHTRKS